MALGERRVLEPTEVERARPMPLVRSRVPWVSGAVIGLSVLTYVIDLATGDEARNLGALYPDSIRSGEWYRMFLSQVVHGNAIHLFFNMSVVWTLGFSFERSIGSLRFLAVSIVSAMGASTFVMWLSPYPTVGASGMILGWAGAMLPLATAVGRRALLTWLLQIAIISLLPFVSWQGHLGGFLFGLVCGVFLRLRTFDIAAAFLVAGSIAAAVATGLAPTPPR
jgi:membrane associated rhomboid family serine protease